MIKSSLRGNREEATQSDKLGVRICVTLKSLSSDYEHKWHRTDDTSNINLVNIHIKTFYV